MSDEHPTVGDLTYELLRKMRSEQLEVRLEIQELKTRMTAIDEHVGDLVISSMGVNNRLDRMDERLGRVERRLDLTDAR